MTSAELAPSRLIAAALIASRSRETLDAHVVAHLVRELEEELELAYACTPPDGSYRAEDCSAGWQAHEPADVIILPLANLIQRCEARGGKVAYIDYYNMLIVAQRTPAIAVGVLVMHERELPEPDLKRILDGLGF